MSSGFPISWRSLSNLHYGAGAQLVRLVEADQEVLVVPPLSPGPPFVRKCAGIRWAGRRLDALQVRSGLPTSKCCGVVASKATPSRRRLPHHAELRLAHPRSCGAGLGLLRTVSRWPWWLIVSPVAYNWFRGTSRRSRRRRGRPAPRRLQGPAVRPRSTDDSYDLFDRGAWQALLKFRSRFEPI